jgi:hypothetical protein
MTLKSAIAKARRLHAKDGRAYAVVDCGSDEFTVKVHAIAAANYPQDIRKVIGA